jgi:hypothetical protein
MSLAASTDLQGDNTHIEGEISAGFKGLCTVQLRYGT